MKVDGNRTLLWVLRTDLGLTGTKYGCGESYCGACTVLINDKAVRSCQTAVKDVEGKAVITIEGLAVNGRLHPLQKAFVEHDALQCGFCTPGMILTAYSFLKEHPRPSEADIIQGMNDNLCRCSSYLRIVKAIQSAARAMATGRVSMKTKKNSPTVVDDQAQGFSLNRRDFLKVVGGGILIFFSAGVLPAQEGSLRFPGLQSLPTDFNAFLRIGANGRVSCFTGKIEMGQGIVTSLAQMLADELDVSVKHIDMVMGDTDQCPWDMGTWGSLSTRVFGPPLRQAGAEARSVLLTLASEHLKLPVDRLIVKDGVVTARQDKTKQVTYARLCEGKVIQRHLQTKPQPKQPAEFKLMGTSLTHQDSLKKVTGGALFAGDIRLPGMLYAKILRPPAHGATLKQVDISALKGDKEILVVQDKDLVAVLHPLPDVAENALSLIKAEFEVPPNTIDNSTIFPHLLQTAPREGQVFGQKGDLEQGEALARQTFEHTYYDHYVAHSAMETHTALAKIEGDRLTLWASTQNPFGLKEEAARTLNLPPQKVRVITPFVGGGFGGKTFNQQAVEAGRLAKLTGKPVQVMWSRKEEFFNDTFRPAAIVKIRSGLTDAGRISFWKYDTYYAGRGVQQFYAVAHYRETAYGSWMTPDAGGQLFRTGAWRAPGNPTNTFARESQIDIMAAKIGAGPARISPEKHHRETDAGHAPGCGRPFRLEEGREPQPAGPGPGLFYGCRGLCGDHGRGRGRSDKRKGAGQAVDLRSRHGVGDQS